MLALALLLAYLLLIYFIVRYAIDNSALKKTIDKDLKKIKDDMSRVVELLEKKE